jgi:hypothetical protein
MVVLLGGVCAVLHARRAQLRGSSLYWSLACDGIEQSSLEAHRNCSRQRRRRQRRGTWMRPALSASPGRDPD